MPGEIPLSWLHRLSMNSTCSEGSQTMTPTSFARARRLLPLLLNFL